ncbi:unnamed protein product, partial [Tenebrio molitor]
MMLAIKQHIHQRDVNTAPYTNIEDVRLTKETAEALIFTAKSTYLCIKYLISDLIFFYVLTRNFSSDAVESIFSNVRLRGGSNDLTDCKAAEHALRQILKSGLIKIVNNSNIISNTEYISNAKLVIPRNSNDTEIVITLNEIVIEKLEKLSVFVHDGFEINSFKMESAATAFLCGYLIMKVAESVNNCELCLSTLRNT